MKKFLCCLIIVMTAAVSFGNTAYGVFPVAPPEQGAPPKETAPAEETETAPAEETLSAETFPAETFQIPRADPAAPSEPAAPEESPEETQPAGESEDGERTAEDERFKINFGNGDEYNPLGDTVGELTERGYMTDQDLDYLVASRAVSEEFTMTRGGIGYAVKAVNPFVKSVPTSECLICYFAITDRGGSVAVDGILYAAGSTRRILPDGMPGPLPKRKTIWSTRSKIPDAAIR